MNVTKVCCQGCGADLEIGENLRFVTCNYGMVSGSNKASRFQSGQADYQHRRARLIARTDQAWRG